MLIETEEKLLIRTNVNSRDTENEDENEFNEEETNNKLNYLVYYDLEEQVEDLSANTGIAKHIIRRILVQQRKMAQSKLTLGYGYNLPGIVKIFPEEKAGKIQLRAVAAQAIVRPRLIRYCEMNKKYDEVNEPELITDDDFE